MEKAIAALSGRRDMADALRRRHREDLFRLSEPLFGFLRREHQITHFYFVSDDRETVLRVHAPDRHGDVIDRYTMRQAETAGMPASGLEMGVLGTFTLRTVVPWRLDGVLIGYLEMGMEISHLLNRIETNVGVVVAQAIEDALVETSARSSGGRYLPDVAQEGLIDGHVLITRLDQELPPFLTGAFDRAVKLKPETSSVIEHDGRTYSITSTLLDDVAGRVVGRLLIAQDISPAVRRDFEALISAVFVIIGLAGVGVLLFLRAAGNAQSAIDGSRARMESAFTEKQRQLDEAQRLAKIGSWELDHQTNTLTWSDEIYRMFGIDAERFGATYEAFLNAIHPEDRDMVETAYRNSLETRSPYMIVHRLLMPGGTVKWVQEQCETKFGDDGRPLLSKGTVLDVTELKRLELARLDSQSRFRAIFENNTEGLIVANEDGVIVEFNKSAATMFGYPAEEVLGQNVSILMPSHDQVRHDGYIHNYTSGGDPKIIGRGRDVVAQRKNGSTFPIRLGIGEFHEGGTRYFVGVITDLTQIKDLETQLKRSQKMEAIGELTGGIAHDFNNLLGIVVGNLDLLKRRIGEDEGLLKRVDKAQAAALRGSDLTRRLLNFSRQSIEASSPININPVIQDLQELVGRSMTSRIALELDLAEDLWLSEVDPSAFEDVVINLAINARDAMPNGGRLIIETRNTEFSRESVGTIGDGVRIGEFVEVSVTDTGIGVPKEIREQIFDPFFTTKEKGKGTGLGLSMVYGFLKRSNGYVNVYSEVGVGTTFKLYLPRSKGQTPEATSMGEVGAKLPRGNETVLIVDDEVDLVDIADAVLSDLGYRTCRANNSDEALAILTDRSDIDLLLTDVVMPGSMDGFALAARAVELRPGIKVVLASGFTGKIMGDDVDPALVETLLAKPYRDQDLAKRVRMTLDGSE